MADSAIIYSDLSLSSPTILTNLDSVYQAVESVLQTAQGERLFRPDYGADLERILFELGDEESETLIFHQIHSSLRDEPRVFLNGETTVEFDPDTHTYDLELWFDVHGLQDGAWNYNGVLSRES